MNEEDLAFLVSLYVVYHKHCKIVTRRYNKLKAVNGMINAVTGVSVLVMSGLAIFLPPIIAVGNGAIVTARIAIGKLGLAEKEAKCKITLSQIRTMLSSIKMRLRAGGSEAMSQAEKDALLFVAKNIDLSVVLSEDEIVWYRKKYEVPESDINETLKIKYPIMLQSQLPL